MNSETRELIVLLGVLFSFICWGIVIAMIGQSLKPL